MPIDYAELRGDGPQAELPDDENRVAYLERAALVDTAKGERVVTEWRDFHRPHIKWQSWNGFGGQQMQYVRELLIGLGIDMSKLTDDEALGSELFDVQGLTYKVHTSSTVMQPRTPGEEPKVFINTYVDARASGTDLQMPLVTDELGTDNSDLLLGVSQNPVNADDPVPWDEPNF